MRSAKLTDGDDQNRVVVPPSEAAAADSTDDRATRESEQFASGKTKDQLAREAEVAEAARTEKFRGHFERISLGILYVLAVALVIIGGVWLYHLVMPYCHHWLTDDQLDDLRGILTGGLIVGVLTDHFRKRLN